MDRSGEIPGVRGRVLRLNRKKLISLDVRFVFA
jgi:hypothetical protein